MRRLLIPGFLCLMLAGCGGSGSSSSPTTSSVTSPGISLAEIANAPQTLTVGSVSMQVTASLYRNFMPTIGSTGTPPLDAVFTVSSITGGALPTGLTVDSAYVEQSSTIGYFGTEVPSTLTSATPNNIIFSTSGGPAWAPGSSAEAVVHLYDASGNTYLLKAPTATIFGAD